MSLEQSQSGSVFTTKSVWFSPTSWFGSEKEKRENALRSGTVVDTIGVGLNVNGEDSGIDLYDSNQEEYFSEDESSSGEAWNPYQPQLERTYATMSDLKYDIWGLRPGEKE